VVEFQQEVGSKHEIFTAKGILQWLSSSKEQGQNTKFSRRKRAYSGEGPAGSMVPIIAPPVWGSGNVGSVTRSLIDRTKRCRESSEHVPDYGVAHVSIQIHWTWVLYTFSPGSLKLKTNNTPPSLQHLSRVNSRGNLPI
jgi:hypothetical protein